MAKFFFKNQHQGRGPMRSQVIGIAWIIVALVAMVGWYFFSMQREKKSPRTLIETPVEIDSLRKKEDSVYHSRRNKQVFYKKSTSYKKKTSTLPLYTHEAPPVRKQALRVELNTADTTTLQLLPGIGPTYAKRIFRYRERLGGFVADSQLLEVYGFTPQLLDVIRPHLELDTAARREIAINSASMKELARHPYIEYYQARDIMNLRAQGVTFSCEEDLRAIPSMADSTLQRILPYLDFAPPKDK